jgi:hypothetical protein
LFDRPKPTAGCSASGRRRRRRMWSYILRIYNFTSQSTVLSQ